MASFDPWLGDQNPTDQQQNEYIRRLKEALLDVSNVVIIDSGNYTGDGSGTVDIDLADLSAQPVVCWVTNTSDGINFFSTKGMLDATDTTLVITGGAGVTAVTNRIGFTDPPSGGLSLAGTTANGLNYNTRNYDWIVLATKA